MKFRRIRIVSDLTEKRSDMALDKKLRTKKKDEKPATTPPSSTLKIDKVEEKDTTLAKDKDGKK